jgi:hypothetical protein
LQKFSFSELLIFDFSWNFREGESRSIQRLDFKGAAVKQQ